MESSVHQCSVRMALDIFSDLEKDDDESLSFHEFGWWYNQFGYEKIQWLEVRELVILSLLKSFCVFTFCFFHSSSICPSGQQPALIQRR